MIPKTIYYVWFGGKALPDDVIKNIESWKKFNPEYEIVQIDETRGDLFNYTDYEFSNSAYQSEKWAFVSDIARLHVIYQKGGIYLDTDVEVLRPLDDIFLDYSEIWAKENSYTVATGLFFAAKKNSENIKNILNIYRKKNFSNDNLKEISTVNIISKYFWSKGLCIQNDRITTIGDSAFYPTHSFAPIHYWGGGKIISTSYAVHKYKASWLPDNNKPLRFIQYSLRWAFNQMTLKNQFCARTIAKIKYR
ncbi:glycosyltransferase family 32 protein [Leuconostoc citreum]